GAEPEAAALVYPLRAPFAIGRPTQCIGLRPHQGLDERGNQFPKQIDVGVLELIAQPLQRLHREIDHRLPPPEFLGRFSLRMKRWSSTSRTLGSFIHHVRGLYAVTGWTSRMGQRPRHLTAQGRHKGKRGPSPDQAVGFRSNSMTSNVRASFNDRSDHSPSGYVTVNSPPN